MILDSVSKHHLNNFIVFTKIRLTFQANLRYIELMLGLDSNLPTHSSCANARPSLDVHRSKEVIFGQTSTHWYSMPLFAVWALFSTFEWALFSTFLVRTKNLFCNRNQSNVREWHFIAIKYCFYVTVKVEWNRTIDELYFIRREDIV